MVRYKGQITARHIDRSHPAQVEIAVPPTGLGRRLTCMLAFCDRRGADYRTRSARRKAIDAMRFCFKSRGDADCFHDQFGGIRIDAEESREP